MTLNLAENLTSGILSLRIHSFHKILPILRNTLYVHTIYICTHIQRFVFLVENPYSCLYRFIFYRFPVTNTRNFTFIHPPVFRFAFLHLRYSCDSYDCSFRIRRKLVRNIFQRFREIGSRVHLKSAQFCIEAFF